MARIMIRKSARGVKKPIARVPRRKSKVSKRMVKRARPMKRTKRTMKKRMMKRRTMRSHCMNVVDKIVENPAMFSTLQSLVTQAGLVDTLVAAQDITVFAPTNDAFARVPQSTLDSLLANPRLLTQVLTYHVVPQRIESGDIAEGETVVNTLAGASLTVVNDGMTIRINGSRVVSADIRASNGIVHVIDSVLIPPM
jgi:uncharacterized surface protein with fasciclin (FAS1) repeats